MSDEWFPACVAAKAEDPDEGMRTERLRMNHDKHDPRNDSQNSDDILTKS